TAGGAADISAAVAATSAAPPAVAEITVEEEWITDYGDTPGDESPVEADDADRHVAYLPPHPEFLEDAPKPGFFRRAMRKLFGRKGVVKNSAKAEDVKDTVKEPSGDSGADPAHANAENDFESKFFDRVDSPIDDRPGADAAKPETPATERGFSDRRAGDRTPAVSAAEAKAAPEEDAGGDRRESDDRRDAARDAKGGRRQADEKRKKGKTKKRRR
ncbi:hypothetical protein K8I61_01610, partial [bacterium]|nr:hypothetical protein [bacterium]